MYFYYISTNKFGYKYYFWYPFIINLIKIKWIHNFLLHISLLYEYMTNIFLQLINLSSNFLPHINNDLTPQKKRVIHYICM